MKVIEYKKYGSPDVLELNAINKPIPKENEILIKVHAATITAVDSIFRNGKHFFARLATGITKPKKSILGFEFSGVVESAGTNAKLFKIAKKQIEVDSEYACARGRRRHLAPVVML